MGVAVGGTGVLVTGIAVAVGGSGVLVARTGVAVWGMGVAVKIGVGEAEETETVPPPKLMSRVALAFTNHKPTYQPPALYVQPVIEREATTIPLR